MREPAPPLAGVTLCAMPPCVHFQATVSPFLMDTLPGENALFLTATVLVWAACAGTVATAAMATAPAISLRVISDQTHTATPLFRDDPAMSLKDKTLFISGASRGIGLQIALRAAQDGANVALIAKTAEPHPKLPGTVFTAAEEIEAAGGKALPIVGDIRDEASVEEAVAKTVERFGGIDITVNNASAINLSRTTDLPVRRYDLMQSINTRGTYVVSKACVPHLKASDNAHVLTLSPPISLDPKWLKSHVGYSIAKYGMSLCTLGMAAEFADDGIAFNALWPKTLIATAAVQNLLGGDVAMAKSRKPEIVADAAHAILTRDSRECTGNLYLVEDVLAEEGVTDLVDYSYAGADADLQVDLFVDSL